MPESKLLNWKILLLEEQKLEPERSVLSNSVSHKIIVRHSFSFRPNNLQQLTKVYTLRNQRRSNYWILKSLMKAEMKFQKSNSSEYWEDGENPSDERSKGATPSNTIARLVGAVLAQSTVGTFCPAAQKGILSKLYLFGWCANNNQHPKNQYWMPVNRPAKGSRFRWGRKLEVAPPAFLYCKPDGRSETVKVNRQTWVLSFEKSTP
jgi:hypothetical protein